MVLEHDMEAHEKVGKIGTISWVDALRQPMSRFGRSVWSQRSRKESNRGAIEKAIARHEIKIGALKKLKGSKKLLEWEARAELLLKMRTVGFKPAANHVVAALATAHGLAQDKLQPKIKLFDGLNYHMRGELFDGVMSQFRRSVQLNLVEKVHGLLHENGRVMGTLEIANGLKLPATNTNRILISTALGVLDLMGLTQKLPPAPRKEYKWVHSCHRFTRETVPVWSLDWWVLQRLREGSKKITDLGKESVRFGYTFGSAGGKFGLASIRECFLRLRAAGLAKTTEHRGGLSATLSKVGKKLLAEQDKLDYLHPEIQVALLGLPLEKGELSETEKRMLPRLMRWARVSLEIEKYVADRTAPPGTPFEGINEIARRAGDRSNYVQQVMVGRRTWRKVSLEKLLDFYTPLVEKSDPELGAYLREYFSRMKTSPSVNPE